MLVVKQGGIKYDLFVFGMIQPEIESLFLSIRKHSNVMTTDSHNPRYIISANVKFAFTSLFLTKFHFSELHFVWHYVTR